MGALDIRHPLAQTLQVGNDLWPTIDVALAVARLQVASIDSKRMLIHVVNGKGGKDRYAMLSPRLLDILRAYWRRARPGVWLFPGQEPGEHVSTGPCRRHAGRRGGKPSLASR